MRRRRPLADELRLATANLNDAVRECRRLAEDDSFQAVNLDILIYRSVLMRAADELHRIAETIKPPRKR